MLKSRDILKDGYRPGLKNKEGPINQIGPIENENIAVQIYGLKRWSASVFDNFLLGRIVPLGLLATR